MGRIKLLSNIINSTTNQVEGYCVIKSVQQRSNSKGSDYLDMVISDVGGEISAKLWDYNALIHGAYYPDSIVKVRGTPTLWKDTEQLKIDRIRPLKPNEEVDMGELLSCAPIDPDLMYQEIYDCAQEFKEEDLKRLVQYILRDNKDKLLSQPAALKVHHAFRGGLLYHTLCMLRVARQLSLIYTRLDMDLVYAGVILHDIAKLTELTVGELGIASGYSVSGQLIGHIALGVAMVERVSAELMIPEEITRLVQHMLLSHHGQPEYGSPKPPMFPEAEVVSLLDLLDAKLFTMYDALENTPVGEFTERIWSLDNRQLYRHGLFIDADTQKRAQTKELDN